MDADYDSYSIQQKCDPIRCCKVDRMYRQKKRMTLSVRDPAYLIQALQTTSARKIVKPPATHMDKELQDCRAQLLQWTEPLMRLEFQWMVELLHWRGIQQNMELLPSLKCQAVELLL